jgi:hypothetical protein
VFTEQHLRLLGNFDRSGSPRDTNGRCIKGPPQVSCYSETCRDRAPPLEACRLNCGPLAHDPLKCEACALGKQDVAVREALTEAQQVTLDTDQQCLEPRDRHGRAVNGDLLVVRRALVQYFGEKSLGLRPSLAPRALAALCIIRSLDDSLPLVRAASKSQAMNRPGACASRRPNAWTRARQLTYLICQEVVRSTALDHAASARLRRSPTQHFEGAALQMISCAPMLGSIGYIVAVQSPSSPSRHSH